MNKEILKKFLEGTCSKEEQDLVINWSSSDTFEKDLEVMLANNWDQDAAQSDIVLSEQIFEKVQARIEHLGPKVYQSKTLKINKFLRYAAVIALVALATYVVNSEGWLRSSVEPVEIALIEKSTSRGQKSTFFLTDGSKVILNSESRLTFPEVFTDSSRNITLEGEAYFEVAKDKARPFSVTANNLVTTALGTSFNISTGADQVVVSLATGKVVVYRNSTEGLSWESQKHILNPGEMLTHNTEEGGFLKTAFDYNETFLWKEGIIYFKDASFEEVADKLEAWYNVKFDITDGSRNRKPYTGEFNNESLENVLKGMSFSLDFDYFLNGEKVKIIFN